MQQEEMIPNYIKSSLSLEPLFKAWKRSLDEGSGGLYRYLLSQVEQHPELRGSLSIEAFDANKGLIDEMMNTVFPLTLSETEDVYAVTCPFSEEVVYSSKVFRNLFLKEGMTKLKLPIENDPTLEQKIRAVACQIILSQHYGMKIPGELKPVFAFASEDPGLHRYFEFEINNSLVEAVYIGKDNAMPSAPEMEANKISDLVAHPEWMEWIPLDRFRFEGITIIQIKDVTEKAVVSNIKNILLNFQSFNDANVYESLQSQVEDLAGVPGLSIGITPFFRINQRRVLPKLNEKQSLLVKPGLETQRAEIADRLEKMFGQSSETFVVEAIADDQLMQYSFLSQVKEAGYCCIAIFPLKTNGQLTGILEVASKKEGTLRNTVLGKIEVVLPLFELALQKISDNLEAQVDKVIKEQFTAIQPSVEWSFIDATIDYLMRQQDDPDARMRSIVFDNVHPMYGAIDIRNSSVERNNAIQKDLLEQLEKVSAIVKEARKIKYYPALKEAEYKIRKFIHAVKNIVLSDEEMSINRFLNQDIIQLFQFLRTAYPELRQKIGDYFAEVNSPIEMLYKHRKHFDESIARINTAVARFIDEEQQKAQQMYPHYFERFVTDGVDFNMYVGQSLCPDSEFTPFYLRNLKLWQLSLLARAAQLADKLEEHLDVRLKTTQLILAHGNPISISFRHAERKFDVDGAYNIRYEIIKKRIDKVHIKETNERLTKPGTIAIVYAHQQEAQEYLEFIEYFHSEGLLEADVERFDLEELQGVSGLKALRVGIQKLAQPKQEMEGNQQESETLATETQNGKQQRERQK